MKRYFLYLTAAFSLNALPSEGQSGQSCEQRVSSLLRGSDVMEDTELPRLVSEEFATSLLSSSFQSFTPERRRLGFAAVREGEKLYRQARLSAGLSALPSVATQAPQDRPHPYWEIGVQAFVVSAFTQEPEKIAAITAMMAYFLHDVDDVADRTLASLISQLPAEALNAEARDFLESHYPKGYLELYDDLLTSVTKVIPHFDRKAFDQSIMRMILGSAMLSSKVLRSQRENFQRANKNRHLDLVKHHPDIYEFLNKEVSTVFYAYTVKSLPDGIFSFYEQDGEKFDPGLMILFGILAAPGLMGENLEYELMNGEVSRDCIVDRSEMSRTIERAVGLLTIEARKGTFDRQQLEAFLQVFKAYGDSFHGVLVKLRLYDSYLSILHEIEGAVSRFDG